MKTEMSAFGIEFMGKCAVEISNAEKWVHFYSMKIKYLVNK